MNLSTFSLLKNHQGSVVIDSELTKKIQKVLLGIIIDFDQCCRENDIDYSLCGGSALGAVRHKGFIPWDDDIDVFMTRKNYDRFLDVYNDFFKDKYTLHSPETTPELGMPIAQLSLNGTVYKTQLAPNRDNPGIYIDIFILENIPDNFVLRKAHGLVSLALGLCLSCSRFNLDKVILLKFYEGASDTALEAIKLKIILGGILRFFLSTKKWCELNNWWNSLCKNSNSKYVACPSGRKHYFGELYPRGFVCKTHYMAFENIEMRVMDGYDYYFKKLYGDDYMIPPPIEKREMHSIIELDLGKYKN